VTTFDSIPVPAELAVEVARRRATGADRHDEVWDGTYTMAPGPSAHHGRVDRLFSAALLPYERRASLYGVTACNIGVPRDFRVPDFSLFRREETAVWNPTAALVVEVLSPGDRAWEKLGFYAVHEVDEVVMVDPDERAVTWMARRGDRYDTVERSGVLEVDVAEVVGQIVWP
jgi:Uma2 family endonuclease